MGLNLAFLFHYYKNNFLLCILSKKLGQSFRYFCQEENLLLNLAFIFYNHDYLGENEYQGSFPNHFEIRRQKSISLPGIWSLCLQLSLCSQWSLFTFFHSWVTSTFLVCWLSVFFRICVFCLLSRIWYDIVTGNDLVGGEGRGAVVDFFLLKKKSNSSLLSLSGKSQILIHFLCVWDCQ